MNLHEHKEEFEELIAIVADYIGVPVDAVRRDYYIVQMMGDEYHNYNLILATTYGFPNRWQLFKGKNAGSDRGRRFAGCSVSQLTSYQHYL